MKKLFALIVRFLYQYVNINWLQDTRFRPYATILRLSWEQVPSRKRTKLEQEDVVLLSTLSKGVFVVRMTVMAA